MDAWTCAITYTATSDGVMGCMLMKATGDDNNDDDDDDEALACITEQLSG